MDTGYDNRVLPVADCLLSLALMSVFVEAWTTFSPRLIPTNRDPIFVAMGFRKRPGSFYSRRYGDKR
jgi:hypothetical protein